MTHAVAHTKSGCFNTLVQKLRERTLFRDSTYIVEVVISMSNTVS